MTNFKSIAGGTAWMLVSALLAYAALEPISVAQAAPATAASSIVCADAAGNAAVSCATA